MKVSSFKKLKELHLSLGGTAKGFYITQFGNDYQTGKPIIALREIAWHSKPSANWTSRLVQGKKFTKRY